jgi:CDGSH-type Zn-finger protein/truncated hemoglobin YjbI/ferredoxin
MTTHHGGPVSEGGRAATDVISAAHARAVQLHDQVSRLAAEPERPAAGDRPTMDAVADRVAASVIRPLGSVLTGLAETPPPAAAAESPAAGQLPLPGEQPWEERLWQLTAEVTGLAGRPATPPPVIEAAAALQDLAWQVLPADGPGGWASRLPALQELQTQAGPLIQSSLNGPYLVTNAAKITNWLGEEIPVRPQMALCRCGASAIKPLCDGSHAKIGFTSGKASGRVADRLDTYEGQQVRVLDNRGTCQHSGYCTDRLPNVFHQGSEPFVTASGGRMDEIIRAVRDCPSGALSFAIDGREAREQVDYSNSRPPCIEISKDGPYRVTGGIVLHDAEGGDESRNAGASREHYALCRCGQSQQKPFCSGMHWHVDFHDPLPPADHEPSIFEWCGGLPALLRMTRLFYEKFVPEDPLLAPLFADMSPDHPERVAKWLAEVFCGPKSYSEDYGGYVRMISQHVGRGLTEEKRARWVTLLLQSAQEAGLPNDAEWRSAFGAYIEWGSRLAVENSQPGARPPAQMPMPHWDWLTSSGPPGSRISALVSQPAGEDTPVVLPASDEPLSFEKHIRQLFRPRDRQSMSFVFDLSAYADVASHATAILGRLRDGSMPCDGAWPEAQVEVFARWVDAGTPE